MEKRKVSPIKEAVQVMLPVVRKVACDNWYLSRIIWRGYFKRPEDFVGVDEKQREAGAKAIVDGELKIRFPGFMEDALGMRARVRLNEFFGVIPRERMKR